MSQRITLLVSALLTALTGIVFAVMKYAMKSDDPFAVANHPLQPWMLSSHVVVAPVTVFALGWIFSGHVVPRIADRLARKRRSGLTALWLVAPMVFSGYLLQVTTGDATRRAMAVAHWVSSTLFVIGFAVHVVPALVKRRQVR